MNHQSILLGNRIPYEYFITKGKGESNAGSQGLPYETGSYDAALNNAGIENANVIEYTSVMPPGVKEISKEEGIKRIQWGEVVECIKAQANGRRGSKISAAIMTTNITDPQGNFLGGFACEYSGNGTQKEAEESLALSIAGMIQRRGYGKMKLPVSLYQENKTDKGYHIHPGFHFEYEFLDVKEEHGTVFVAICFTSHHYPMVSSFSSSSNKKTKRTRKNHRK
jgi:arginine decarboxylase